VTGPKLNEAPVRVSGRRRVRVAEETVAFRAKARYMRVSAYKVREALDLIRGLDAERAVETLRLSERDAATVVGKVLASAIANAEHHHEHPVEGDELYVSALEDRIEADLALGRPAEVVPELESLVARHPVRERLRPVSPVPATGAAASPAASGPPARKRRRP